MSLMQKHVGQCFLYFRHVSNKNFCMPTCWLICKSDVLPISNCEQHTKVERESENAYSDDEDEELLTTNKQGRWCWHEQEWRHHWHQYLWMMMHKIDANDWYLWYSGRKFNLFFRSSFKLCHPVCFEVITTYSLEKMPLMYAVCVINIEYVFLIIFGSKSDPQCSANFRQLWWQMAKWAEHHARVIVSYMQVNMYQFF